MATFSWLSASVLSLLAGVLGTALALCFFVVWDNARTKMHKAVAIVFLFTLVSPGGRLMHFAFHGTQEARENWKQAQVSKTASLLVNEYAWREAIAEWPKGVTEIYVDGGLPIAIEQDCQFKMQYWTAREDIIGRHFTIVRLVQQVS